jgi:hypothetical protein
MSPKRAHAPAPKVDAASNGARGTARLACATSKATQGALKNTCATITALKL